MAAVNRNNVLFGCRGPLIFNGLRVVPEVEKLESRPVLNLLFSSEMRDSIRSLSRGSSVGSKVVLENHSLTTMIGFRLYSEAGSRSLRGWTGPCAGGEQCSGAGGEPLRPVTTAEAGGRTAERLIEAGG